MRRSAGTHMDLAGVDPDVADAIVTQAAAAERYVSELYRGRLRPRLDPLGDVDRPNGEIVDVKTIPRPTSRFVNGGKHRPVRLSIVVARLPELRVVGAVEPGAWRYGLPPIPRAEPCYYALVSELDPAPPRAPVFGLERVREWSRRLQSDAKRAYDREAKRRQRLRSDAAPVPAFYPDEPAPGRLRHGLIAHSVPGRGSKTREDEP